MEFSKGVTADISRHTFLLFLLFVMINLLSAL